MAQRKAQLDATDWKILEELQKDARKTYQELGDVVGMTRPAVRERIVRMEESGVIEGWHAQISPAAVGRPLHAMLVFKFFSDADYGEKGPNDTLIPLLDSSLAVVRYWDTYGDLDFMIEAAFPTKEAMDELLAKLRRFGFVRTHIIVRARTRPYKELPSKD